MQHSSISTDLPLYFESWCQSLYKQSLKREFKMYITVYISLSLTFVSFSYICNLYPGMNPCLLMWLMAILAAASSDCPEIAECVALNSNNPPMWITVRGSSETGTCKYLLLAQNKQHYKYSAPQSGIFQQYFILQWFLHDLWPLKTYLETNAYKNVIVIVELITCSIKLPGV